MKNVLGNETSFFDFIEFHDLPNAAYCKDNIFFRKASKRVLFRKLELQYVLSVPLVSTVISKHLHHMGGKQFARVSLPNDKVRLCHSPLFKDA